MMLQGTHSLAHPLSPWTGFTVMCAYALALTGFAAWRLPHADA
jgi:ABC-2 type transport system permease protein